MDLKNKSKLEEEISVLIDRLQSHISVKRDEASIQPIQELYETIKPMLKDESAIPRVSLEKLLTSGQDFFKEMGLGLKEGYEDEIVCQQISAIYTIITLHSRYQQRERIIKKVQGEQSKRFKNIYV